MGEEGRERKGEVRLVEEKGGEAGKIIRTGRERRGDRRGGMRKSQKGSVGSGGIDVWGT